MKSVLKDLTGKKFGMLQVLERAPTRITPNGTKQTYWWVRCDCDKELQCSSANLLYRKRKSPISCGCSFKKAREEKVRKGIWRKDAIDISGEKFGTRKVIGCVGLYKSGQRKWAFVCDCGKQGTSTATSLRNSKSCGCLNPKMKQKKPKYDWPDYKTRIVSVRSVLAKSKNKDPKCSLSYQDVHRFLYSNCFYCGKKGTTKNRLGIDRVDPNCGYQKENCVSACWTCNKVKSTMTINDLKKHLKKMLVNLGE